MSQVEALSNIISRLLWGTLKGFLNLRGISKIFILKESLIFENY